MIVDWQYDPIKDNLLHVDLKRIDLTKRITVNVPVVTHGEPKGVKVQGGLLELVTREIEIECLPNEIPEQFTIDVTGIDDRAEHPRLRHCRCRRVMKLMSAPENVIAHVVALRQIEEPVAAVETPEAAATPAAGGTAAEPEVLKKGKKEEEAAERKPGEEEVSHPGRGVARLRGRVMSDWLLVGLGNPDPSTNCRRTISGFWWSTGWPSDTGSA